MQKTLRLSSLYTCIGMFLVLVMGDLVTYTGSSQGCGAHWPLCNGKFWPNLTLSSIIEYSHRAVSGIVGILVLVTALLIWIKHRKNTALVLYAMGALVFTVFQALLGAAAVLRPQSPTVLAFHFGISLLAFVCTLLIVLEVRMGSSWLPDSAEVKASFRWHVWLTTIYCYGVVYLGAFVKHTHSSGGCSGWPLCNGKVVPDLHGATRIIFTHRLGALLLFLLVLWIFARIAVQYGQYRVLRIAGIWVLVFIVLQILSGALVTLTLTDKNWSLLTAMIHIILITGLFGSLCYLCLLVRRRNP